MPSLSALVSPPQIVHNGYNHNVRFRGTLYHIQTEVSGHDVVTIRSHVFENGAVVASSKTTCSPSTEAELDTLAKASHKGLIQELVRGKPTEVPGDGDRRRSERVADAAPGAAGEGDLHEVLSLRHAIASLGRTSERAPSKASVRSLGNAMAVIFGKKASNLRVEDLADLHLLHAEILEWITAEGSQSALEALFSEARELVSRLRQLSRRESILQHDRAVLRELGPVSVSRLEALRPLEGLDSRLDLALEGEPLTEGDLRGILDRIVGSLVDTEGVSAAT